MRRRIARSEGRHLFGSDPAAYDYARPGHAERVYELLVGRCALRAGSTVLEIGPGTGKATRRLLELGADPLVAIEPDPSLASYLRTSFDDRLEVRLEALEDAKLEADRFDLAVAASCFHWIEEGAGLEKVAAALRPGGCWSMWWTLFGDGQRKDAFMTAIDPLLADVPRSPSAGSGAGRPAFALDVEARTNALSKAGFEALAHELVRWDATWDSSGIRALYSTFSPIQVLDEDSRERLLDEIAAIAERDFGGNVSRKLTTSVYVARKPGRPDDRTISS